MFVSKFKSLLQARFAREEKGAAHIEAMIMIPLMFGVMVSRETLPLDADYLEGTHHLLNSLTRTPQDSSLRLSVVRYDSNNDIMKLDWSKASGGYTVLSNNQVRSWTSKLPHMVHNERMIIVETFARWESPFNIGLGVQEIDNFVFTRPRYGPQVLWVDLPDLEFTGS